MKMITDAESSPDTTVNIDAKNLSTPELNIRLREAISNGKDI
jgi:hypothetical protein